jgi:DNA-binding transcriptional regulator YiaG/uncharacterized DUF497 family protein
MAMDFEWDEAKDEWTRRKRGFGFDKAALMFDRPVQTAIDDRHDYGEQRLIAIGEADGDVLVVVYTDPGERQADHLGAPSQPEGTRDMAIVRKTLDEIRAAKSRVDRAKIDATTDEEIARQIAEDPDTAPEVTLDMLIAPANLRRRLNMTQEQFAAALGIPVATLRNWEQGRNAIDPAARSLLMLVARDPEGTLAALAAARSAA